MKYLIIALVFLGITAPQARTQPFLGRGDDIKKQLDLTEEQAASLKEIRLKTAKQMIDIRSSIAKKALDLKAIMAEPAPDRNAVKTLMADIGTLKIERNMLLFDTRTATMKLLTPEQQTKMKELRQQRGKKMKRGMKDRMKRPGSGMRSGDWGVGPTGPPMGFFDDSHEEE